MSTFSSHIFAITETWLNDTIQDSFLLPSSAYRLFRSDDRSNQRKRGVAAYVSTQLNAVKLENQMNNVLTVVCDV